MNQLYHSLPVLRKYSISAKAVVCRGALASFLFVASLAASPDAKLETGFASPPASARPHTYWLWLNGHVDLPVAARELRDMKEAGLGGVLLFEMGAKGDTARKPPVGPAFLSDEWVGKLGKVLELARTEDLQVDMSVISSWDLGGPWVDPAHASMGLYSTEQAFTGGQLIDVDLAFPVPEKKAPLGKDGRPAFWTDVAVLAIKEPRRIPAHTFVIQLDQGETHEIRRLEFDQGSYTAPADLSLRMSPVRIFRVSVSSTGTDPDEFTQVITGELAADPGPQGFALPSGTSARYLRLELLDAHEEARPCWTLGEFRAFDPNGVNVAGSRRVHLNRNGAQLVQSPPPLTFYEWNADNLIDGDIEGSGGVFCTAGLPPFDLGPDTEIVDVTRQVDGSGRLRWNAPSGNWVVQRYVCMITGERLKIPSPASDGLATDHLNPEATRLHMNHVISQLQSGLGDLSKSGLSHLYLASYEVVGRVWSPGFAEEFARRRGYGLVRFLPAIFGARVIDREMTERFLFDYQKTLGEVLVDAYYRTAREIARSAGLTIKSEAGGPGPPIHTPPVDALLAYSAVDGIQGEFWPHWTEMDGIWVVKETASAGHIYGKPVIHMESFTSFHHWADGPQDLKPSADRVFCEGGNHFVWHTWTHQPPGAGLPGWAYHAGTHLNRNLVWWPQADAFLDYLARGSFMMQQGRFVADVLYYYGDGGANFVPPRKVQPTLGPGYDYDVTNADVILNRLAASDGRLVLPDGMSYTILVLPDDDAINPDVLARIEELVLDGATLVGERPVRATGLSGFPESDQRVRELARRIWGDLDGVDLRHRRYGKGHVYQGLTEAEVLARMEVEPDFVADRTLDFAHRREGDCDIYFVRNTANRTISTTPSFRVDGRSPELWDPVTGRIEKVVTHQSTGGRVDVPLTLAPFGSAFVVFQAENSGLPDVAMVSSGAHVESRGGNPVLVASENGAYEATLADGRRVRVSVRDLPDPLDLNRDWSLSFASPTGGPDPLTLKRVAPWTSLQDDQYQYFSGTGEYRRTFTLSTDWLQPQRRVELDLGYLWAVGEVLVNGQSQGAVWTAPYRIDCTDALKSGTNEIVIRIYNTWHNRLVGDARIPLADRVTHTNILHSQGEGLRENTWADLDIIDSGLFGPVRLIPLAAEPISP